MDSGIAQFIPLILIFVIFYFFLIRPQQKKVKDHKLMVENLKRGDKVVTSGFSEIYPAGLPVGKVAGVYDERGSFQKMVNVTLPNDISTFQYVFVLIGDENEIK